MDVLENVPCPHCGRKYMEISDMLTHTQRYVEDPEKIVPFTDMISFSFRCPACFTSGDAQLPEMKFKIAKEDRVNVGQSGIVVKRWWWIVASQMTEEAYPLLFPNGTISEH